jgi:Fic family protein
MVKLNQFEAGNKINAKTPQGEVYLAFSPEKINKEFIWDDSKIDLLLADAYRWLGELNAYSKLIPDVDYFIQSHVAKEAEQSSRIEGTITTLEELYLDKEDLVDTEQVNDQEEVKNYIKALNDSIQTIHTAGEPPLAMRVVCAAHKTLLSGVRGFKKQPGIIRTTQNKIGGSQGRLEDAVFIPPTPEMVASLLDDLEKFWHNSELEIPDLVKIALAHYQFETIHPFLDGNGRIGRLIIVLQLISYQILSKPTLYLSDYFEKNRAAYYDALSRVRESNDIEHWIKFFLVGVGETAKRGKETLERIIDLRKKYDDLIEGGIGIKRGKHAKDLLKHLFKKPVVNAGDVEQMINVTTPTANAIIKDLVRIGILKEKTGFSRNRIYTLHEYLGLFNQ